MFVPLRFSTVAKEWRAEYVVTGGSPVALAIRDNTLLHFCMASSTIRAVFMLSSFPVANLKSGVSGLPSLGLPQRSIIFSISGVSTARMVRICLDVFFVLALTKQISPPTIFP